MEGRVGRVAKVDTSMTLGVADFLASKQGQGGLLLGFQVASQLPYSQMNNPVLARKLQHRFKYCNKGFVRVKWLVSLSISSFPNFSVQQPVSSICFVG
mgnify:CR=1 FL=1